MLKEFNLSTTQRDGMYNITRNVKAVIEESGIRSGLCVIYCPHTTAGITINENSDPDVVRDLLLGMDQAFPDRPEFRHKEGNSRAHLKSSVIGASQVLIVENGKPFLGVWQGIYFCEFDGPRDRRYFIKVIGNGIQ